MNPALPIMIIVVFIFISLFLTFISRYRKCSSNEVLVVYGTSGKSEKAAKVIHGGGVFVWPIIQAFGVMSLEPLSIEINLAGALSKNNIRINVPSSFTVAISTEESVVNNATQRLFGLDKNSIKQIAEDIITGQLRVAVASMTIEEINGDREKFLSSINENVVDELRKVGLDVLNVNIRDISDESGYIEAIGKKAASTALNKAKVDVAIQEKEGSIGAAEADRERGVRVAEEKSLEEQGIKKAEKEKAVRLAQLQAEKVEGENLSESAIAKSNAELHKNQAEYKRLSEVAIAESEREILEAEKLSELAKLAKEEVAKVEVEKQKMILDAQAVAEKNREIAKGEADAIKLKYEAEAVGIQQILKAKSEGYETLIKSSGSAEAAASLLMVEKIEEITRIQTKAIADLKIDKVTVWDSGNGSGQGAGVKSFISDLVTSMPGLHEISDQAGIKLPDFLGNLKSDEAIEEKDSSEVKIEDENISL